MNIHLNFIITYQLRPKTPDGSMRLLIWGENLILLVTCHFTANGCCETFPDCCETFPDCCESFPDCCERFPVCCESFPICNQTFSFNDNGHDKLKGWVRDIS